VRGPRAAAAGALSDLDRCGTCRGTISVVTVPVHDVLAESRAALRIGDAAAARRLLEGAYADPTSGAVLEGLAQTSYLQFDFVRCVEEWERAYAAHRRSGEHVGAVRVARTVACVHLMILGNGAVGRGWLSRAQTLLGDAAGSPEAGWVALDIGMFEGDRSRKIEHFREALSRGRAAGDTDLEFVALAYLGAALVHADRTVEGMALLDESLAAVAGNDVEDFFILEDIFCQLFSACEHACDVERADEWIRVGEAIAARRKLPAVSAFCRTHYGGVLTTAGRWSEAEVALTDAIRLWGLGQRSALRSGALVRLAELRVRQGRFEEAEQLLENLDSHIAEEAVRSVASIHLARSEAELAREVLERALEQVDADSAAAAPLWALLVEAHLAADRPASAHSAAERLARCAERTPAPHLVATAALARGLVCLATGDDPNACLREAMAGFSRAHMPMELARCRMTLARALLTQRPEVAMAEARAALEAFQRLPAARDADGAAALLRSLGVRPSAVRHGEGQLTAREVEVLQLLGHGLSNPEIADRLFISRKTVEHHVGNVLSKLGLRSRAEAAGYVARTNHAAK
jgi:DNA-binding NarL/FixJ family response regulator